MSPSAERRFLVSFLYDFLVMLIFAWPVAARGRWEQRSVQDKKIRQRQLLSCL
jgi:hypothetical protein